MKNLLLMLMRMELKMTKVELICHTCGGKRFKKRRYMSSPKNQTKEESFECVRCNEWINIEYSAKWLQYNKVK